MNNVGGNVGFCTVSTKTNIGVKMKMKIVANLRTLLNGFKIDFKIDCSCKVYNLFENIAKNLKNIPVIVLDNSIYKNLF